MSDEPIKGHNGGNGAICFFCGRFFARLDVPRRDGADVDFVHHPAEDGWPTAAGVLLHPPSMCAALSCFIRSVKCPTCPFKPTAVILMVDSNVQRENVLPSEKARAYKMKLDAIKRKAGRPSKENSAQVGQNFSVEKVAEDAGESKSQIQRYIRLNELIPELLEMVDGNEIKFNPAYELAFLRPEEQAVLYDILQAEEVTPSLSQAQRLKRASQEGRLSEQDIAAIMREEKAQTRDTGKVTLPAKEIEQFFPKSYTPAQKKKVIVKLLASWARQRGEKER